MSLIPSDTITEADLQAWYKMHADLAKLKASEMLLRQRVFRHFFPNPIEGTNTFNLEAVEGVPYALKATYPIIRKIDEALLTVATPDLREKGIPIDSLVKRQPELVISAYRLLTAEEQALFDRVMEIKPGSPSMKIEQVKKASK